MAVSVGQNQNYRLRDLRNEQLGKAKGEGGAQRPSRTTRRFEETLKNPKAGEVVGEFPAKYDKAPQRQQLRRQPLLVAKDRSRPRSAVAALMAREGISTHTKLSSKWQKAARDERAKQAEQEKADEAPAWMALLDEVDPEAKARMEKKQREIKAVDGFLSTVGGYSELEQSLKRNDERTLAEAGKLDKALRASGSAVGQGPKTKQEQQMAIMKAEMAMDQQLNLHYLALQDKMQKGYEGLLSNIMKIRNDLTKEAISGGGG